MAQENFQKNKWKEREEVATEKRKWVRLTRICNNNCIFCLDKDNQNGTVIPFPEIESKLKSGRKQGCVRAILSGGEPTLHPDYIRIIKRAKELGYNYIQTVTNGRMFAYKKFLERCVEAGLNEITFTLPGHTKKLFEAQTRTKGSYEQTLKGVINALRAGLIVSADIVINKFTYKHLLKIIKFYVNLGVREFDLLQVMPYSNAWWNRKKVLYDVDKAYPYLRKVFDFSTKVNFFIWTNRFPPHFLEGYEELIQDPYKLHAEVEERKERFENIIKGKEKMFPCYPDACSYCFWQNFAKTVMELRELRKKYYLNPVSGEKITQSIKIKNKADFNKLKKLNHRINYEIFLNKNTEDWVLRNQEKLREIKENVVLTLENHLLFSKSRENDINLKKFFQKIKIPGLRIKNIPYCIYPQGKILKRELKNLPFRGERVDIHEVVDWYILNRYYTKSLRCKDCKFYRECPGMHINYIRNFGYKILSPIKK